MTIFSVIGLLLQVIKLAIDLARKKGPAAASLEIKQMRTSLKGIK